MTEGPYKLPGGWRWVRLGEVCVLRNGKFIRKSELQESGTIRVYGSNGLIGYTTGTSVVIDRDTIVIGRVGACGAINWAMAPAWVSDNAMYVARWLIPCEPHYIVLALKQANLGSFSKQGAPPSISQDQAYSAPIPLPPLSEQRRIVARIEELMARVREARRLRQQAREDADRLWQSVLADTFPRPGSDLPEGWRWVRLGEVCLPTERRDPTKDPSAPFIYVDISAVDSAEGKIVSPRELLGQDAPSRARKVIRSCDVIFATTRPYLKNVAMVGPELDNQLCSTGFCVLRANPGVVEPGLLFYLCRSDLVVAQLSGNNMRGANYPAVTDRDVYEALIPLPPLSEQRWIVAHLEEVREHIQALKKAQEDTEARLEDLERSILDKAFRGEL